MESRIGLCWDFVLQNRVDRADRVVECRGVMEDPWQSTTSTGIKDIICGSLSGKHRRSARESLSRTGA